MRKGKDRRKAWKRRILPGRPSPAPGTADVPSPAPAFHSRARSAQPGHPQPCHPGCRDAPRARPPRMCPRSRRGFLGRPSAGRGLWLSPFFRPAPDPPGRPSPSPTQQGRGGGWRQAGLGSPPGWSHFLGTPVRPRGSVPAGCPRSAPGRGYFQPGLGRAPRGPGSHQCPAFSLVQQQAPAPAAGSLDPRSHFHGNSPRPWETLPGLSFPPQEAGKEGGRGDIRLSAPQPRPQAGCQGDGHCGGSFWLGKRTRCPAASPRGLCCGVPPAPWGSLPFPGRAGTQPQHCCPARAPRGEHLAAPAATA